MAKSSGWRKFFDGHAPEYMQNVFTRHTVAEVDFALEELGVEPGASILDVGCGTGRHAVELVRRGPIDLDEIEIMVVAERAS